MKSEGTLQGQVTAGLEAQASFYWQFDTIANILDPWVVKCESLPASSLKGARCNVTALNLQSSYSNFDQWWEVRLGR